MIRTALPLIALLLAGCTSTAAAPEPPTVEDDPVALAACNLALRAAEEMVTEKKELATLLTSSQAAQRAVLSSDPGVREAGRNLFPVSEEGVRMLWRDKAGADEMEPVRQEVNAALQGLIAACNTRLGPQPWAGA